MRGFSPAPSPKASSDPCKELDIRASRDLMNRTVGLKGPPQYFNEYYLAYIKGSSNKFHYFVLLQDSTSKEYIGLNTYGRRCGSPRIKVIARSADFNRVEASWRAKLMQKKSKGYKES